MNINKFLKKLGHDTIAASFYRYIKMWEEFYRGDVRNFHSYRIYNGKTYTRQRRYSLGMAAKVCQDMADLLLNEHVGIVIDDETTQEYVDNVLDVNRFWTKGNEYQERKSYSGTVAYVLHIENALADEQGNIIGGKVGINYVSAGDIYPITWNNGVISECAFAFHHTIMGKSYEHIQIHLIDSDGTYRIENHICENDENGKEVPPEKWGELGKLAYLAPVVHTASDRRQFVIDTLNLTNSVDEDNPMGVALFANSLDQIKGLDVAFDSYVNEFVLGKKRIYVTPDMLRESITGDVSFDSNDVVFYMLPEEMKDGNKPIVESNMELRADEHNKAINDFLNILSVKVGFGTKHYKFEGGGVTTATQVISENSDMFRTIKKHEIVLEDVLTELIDIIIRLGITTGASVDPEASVNIRFDDSIIEDKVSERESDRADVSMGAMQLAEYRAKWYNEDIEVAKTKIVVDMPEFEPEEE